MQANYYTGQLIEDTAIFLMLEEKLAVGLIKKWYMYIPYFMGI